MNSPQSQYSFSSFQSFVTNNFSLLVIAVLIYAAGVFTGSIWTENALLKAGKGATAGTAAADPSAAPQGPTPEQLASVPPADADDHLQGSADAKVVLIEYSDFECPFCARFHPTVKQLKEEFGDQIAIGYRHFPLSFHPFAQKAGEASECVAKLGGDDGFWKYSDYVFTENEKQQGINDAVITAGAEAAGVNMAQFKTCLDSGEMAEKITADTDTGVAAGITGTPGTIIITEDGAQEIIVGALPYEQVKATVEKYL